MYYEYSFNLTEHQKKKIINAHKNKTGVKLDYLIQVYIQTAMLLFD